MTINLTRYAQIDITIMLLFSLSQYFIDEIITARRSYKQLKRKFLVTVNETFRLETVLNKHEPSYVLM